MHRIGFQNGVQERKRTCAASTTTRRCTSQQRRSTSRLSATSWRTVRVVPAYSLIAYLPLQLRRLIVWPLNVHSTLRAGYAQPNELSSDGENVMFLLGFYGGNSPSLFITTLYKLVYVIYFLIYIM
jgi:hypothetical protein